jgi:hypothetical protein
MSPIVENGSFTQRRHKAKMRLNITVNQQGILDQDLVLQLLRTTHYC